MQMDFTFVIMLSLFIPNVIYCLSYDCLFTCGLQWF